MRKLYIAPTSQREKWKFVAWVIIVLSVLFVMPGIAGFYENHYWNTGIVTSVVNETVTVEDTEGNEWDFICDSKNDYSVGDKVRLRFSTNYTDSNIYDDEVENVTVIK